MIECKRLSPFILTAGILAADQATKALVVRNIPYNSIAVSFFGDFLRIIHARNKGAAFSIGHGFPDAIRFFIFSVIPIIVIGWLIYYIYTSKELLPRDRWILAGIAGGGMGNIIDRLFRADGVVDFIDVKFYGIFGMERWPTFNIADASVVVCGILFVLCMVFSPKEKNQ